MRKGFEERLWVADCLPYNSMFLKITFVEPYERLHGKKALWKKWFGQCWLTCSSHGVARHRGEKLGDDVWKPRPGPSRTGSPFPLLFLVCVLSL